MMHLATERLFDARSFSYLHALIRSRTGIYLLERELTSYERPLMLFMRENGFQTIEDLIESLEKGRPGIAQKTVDLFTQRDSFFFEEPLLYEMSEKMLLPRLLSQKNKEETLRIWVAACSTGEDVYSFAVFMQEKFSKSSFEILGTDLSAEAVDRAKLGIYPQDKIIRHTPKNLISRYFKPLNGDFQVDIDIRQKVSFQNHNLLNSFEAPSPFDLILCRHVLSSFDGSLKAKVLNTFADHLTPNGLLILGSQETLLGSSSKFEVI